MSLQPSSTLSAMQPAASTASGRVPRLPADLIFVIIAWCEALETQRENTLAALWLLSRQYTSAAQRSLYSHLDLDRALRAVDLGLDFDYDFFAPEWDLDGMAKKTGLETLSPRRELLPYVKCVTARRVSEELERAGARAVFEDLPNVEKLAGTANDEIVHLILRQPGVRIKSLEINVWDDAAAQLIEDYHEAFEALEQLWAYSILWPPPSTLEHVKTLTIPCARGPDDLHAFIASFRHSLTRLNLTTHFLLEKLEITDFPRVDKLNIGFSPTFVSIWGAQRVAAVLRSTTNLVSLGLCGMVPLEAAGKPRLRAPPVDYSSLTSVHRSLDSETDSYGPSAARTSAILDALPASLQHLTIIADNLPAQLLIPYLLEPSRPPSLVTLRLGGRLGLELGDMLRDRGAAPGRGPVGALAGELERAGIELTTTARGVW